MKLAANDVQILVIHGCGHYTSEEVTDEMLAAVTIFLASYRDGSAAAHNPQAACCHLASG